MDARAFAGGGFCLPALAVLVAVWACPGCSRAPVSESQTGPQAQSQVGGTVSVLVPGGVLGPYIEIKDLFAQRHPALVITHEMNSIQVLTRWVVDQERLPDVWLSLGDQEMSRAVQAGRVDGELLTCAHMQLALITKAGNPLGIEGLADLAQASIAEVALPDPQNSAGFHLERALQQAGLSEALADRTWYGPEPYHVKERVAWGHADVGVIYYPCSLETEETSEPTPTRMPESMHLVGKIPWDVVAPIPVQAAVIRGCNHLDAGRAFSQFLLSEPAQRAFARWGFLPAQTGAEARPSPR